MRSRPPSWINLLPARSLGGLAGIFILLALSPEGKARTPEIRSASSASPTYNSESFVKELSRLKTGLEAARKSPEALRAYRQSLPPAWRVESSGRRFDVPTDMLASRLQKGEKDPEARRKQLDEARDYLNALGSEAESLSRPAPPPEKSARRKLDAILARPEYAHARRQTWWEQLQARLNEILLNAFLRLLRGVGGQRTLGTILLWLCVCGAAVLIAYWIFRRWFRAARMEEMALQYAAVPARSWQEWLFAARDAAGRGDHRLAIHSAYWAGIARLQDLGALSAGRSKTPREYLRALAESKLIVPETLGARQRALSTLTSRLEKVWYGYQTATDTDFRDSLVQLEALGCQLP